MVCINLIRGLSWFRGSGIHGIRGLHSLLVQVLMVCIYLIEGASMVYWFRYLCYMSVLICYRGPPWFSGSGIHGMY
jgi:hypothetical protein